MWYTFWMQNVHFVVEVLFALACFMTAWLYIDTWQHKKEAKTLVRAVGFLVLALWSALGATSLDIYWLNLATTIAELVGIVLVLVSFILDPLPKLPGQNGKTAEKDVVQDVTPPASTGKGAAAAFLPTTGFLGAVLQGEVVAAVLLAVITVMVFRRATTGLIKEWKPFAVFFLLFTLSEVVAFFYHWVDSANVVVSRLLAEFGAVWYVEHGLKIVTLVVLASWSWGYIRFRLLPQMFIMTVASAFGIFIVTTVVFATILLQNIQQDQLTQMEVSLKTAEYGVDQLGERAVLAAKIASEKNQMQQAITDRDLDTMFAVTNRLMHENGMDFFTTTDVTADVLMRADDRTRTGDSLADDPVVIQSSEGFTLSSAAVSDGLTAPEISIRAGSPILSEGGKVIGSSVTGFTIDNAFVDGLKEVTGLDVTVFGGDQRSATTLMSSDGVSREIGTVETDEDVLETVLQQGEAHSTTVDVLGVPFYAAYTPIKDLDEHVIGMLSVGRPQLAMLDATNRTIQMTFLASVILMVLSLLPAYFIARYIARYQKV